MNNRQLKDLSMEEFVLLKESGMLWELHPEATGNWAVDTGRKSSYDWLEEPQFKDLKIINPDGWDRLNFEKSMEELITIEEFNKRVSLSTIWLVTKEEKIPIYFVKFEGGHCAFENLNSALEELKGLAQEEDDGFSASLEIKYMSREEYNNMPEFGGW